MGCGLWVERSRQITQISLSLLCSLFFVCSVGISDERKRPVLRQGRWSWIGEGQTTPWMKVPLLHCTPKERVLCFLSLSTPLACTSSLWSVPLLLMHAWPDRSPSFLLCFCYRAMRAPSWVVSVRPRVVLGLFISSSLHFLNCARYHPKPILPSHASSVFLTLTTPFAPFGPSPLPFSLPPFSVSGARTLSCFGFFSFL